MQAIGSWTTQGSLAVSAKDVLIVHKRMTMLVNSGMERLQSRVSRSGRP